MMLWLNNKSNDRFFHIRFSFPHEKRRQQLGWFYRMNNCWIVSNFNFRRDKRRKMNENFGQFQMFDVLKYRHYRLTIIMIECTPNESYDVLWCSRSCRMLLCRHMEAVGKNTWNWKSRKNETGSAKRRNVWQELAWRHGVIRTGSELIMKCDATCRKWIRLRVFARKLAIFCMSCIWENNNYRNRTHGTGAAHITGRHTATLESHCSLKSVPSSVTPMRPNSMLIHKCVLINVHISSHCFVVVRGGIEKVLERMNQSFALEVCTCAAKGTWHTRQPDHKLGTAFLSQKYTH